MRKFSADYEFQEKTKARRQVQMRHRLIWIGLRTGDLNSSDFAKQRLIFNLFFDAPQQGHVAIALSRFPR